VLSFLEDQRVKGYSERTVRTQEHVLFAFVAWCTDRGLRYPEEVSPLVLERYQRWLYRYRQANGKPLSFRTQHARLTHVRSYFRWLTRRRFLLYNPAAELELPKYSRRLPMQSLTAAEAEQVLAQADPATPLGLRDRAILETFYSTGLRRAELIGLDLYDLEIERGCLAIRRGKGDKDRVVPIGWRALAWVVRYLEEVRPALLCRPEEPALFLNGYGERFSPEGMTHRVRRYVVASEVPKKGSCHLFRHTMATLMLEGGADIRFIQEILGHARLDTTQIYTQVSIQHLCRIHETTHPASRRRGDSEAEGGEAPPDPEPPARL
jgi:integrase/recombinase XerD